MKQKLRIYHPGLLDFGQKDFQYTCRKDFKKYPAFNGIFVGTEIKPNFPHPTKKELQRDKEFYPIFTSYYFPSVEKELLKQLPQIYELDHWYLDYAYKKAWLLRRFLEKDRKGGENARRLNYLKRLVHNHYNQAKDLLDLLFLDVYFQNKIFNSEYEKDYRNAMVNRFQFLLIKKIKPLIKKDKKYITQEVMREERIYIDTYDEIKNEKWVLTAEAVEILLEKLKKIVGCPMNELVGRPLSPLEIKKQIGEAKSFQGVVRKDKEAKELFRFEDLKEVERRLKEKRKKQLIYRQSFYRGRRRGSLESIGLYMKYQSHILHILPVFVGIAKNVIANRFRKVTELKEIPYSDEIDPAKYRVRRQEEPKEDFFSVEKLAEVLDVPLRTAYFYLRLLPPEKVINPLFYKTPLIKRDFVKPRFLIKKEYVEELKRKVRENKIKKMIYSRWIKFLMEEKEFTLSGAGKLIHRWTKKGVKDKSFFYTTPPSKPEVRKIEQEYRRLDRRFKNKNNVN